MTIPHLILAIAATTAAQEPTLADRATAYYHFSLGQQRRLANDDDGAIAEFRQALRLDPGAAQIRAELARQLRRRGLLEEALEEARAAVEIDPDSQLAHQMLAELYRRQVGARGADAIRESAAELEEVLRLRPTDRHTLQLVATYYAEIRDHESAVGAWQRLLQLDSGNFDGYLRMGMHLRALEREQEAEAAFRQALELRPDSPDAHAAMGDVLAAEAPDAALPYYEHVIELEPQNLRVQLALAEVYSRLGEHDKVLERVQAVLREDPQNRFALERKGRALRDLKRLDEAQRVAEDLVATDPSDLQAAFLKVTIAEARRDARMAIQELQRILERDRSEEEPGQSRNNDRIFLVHLGFAHQQLDQPMAAAEAFGRARESADDPDPALASYQIEALRQADDLDSALAVAREAREEFPEDSGLVSAEATLMRESGDPEGGRALIEALRERSGADVEALLEIADYYQRAKSYSDAEAALQTARQLQPEDVPTLFRLGAVLERQKRHDEAEQVFRAALELDPESAPVLNYLGYMNADRGVRLEESLDLIERALTLDPENGAYLDSLGWALFRLDRLEQAEAKLRLAIERQGENAVVLDHMGDILDRRGELREAVEFWKKALEGEDEDEELDRGRVERKIREAMVLIEGDDTQAREPR